MSAREQYAPGSATGAEIRKDGEQWTLVLVRDLPHPPAKVWQALTDPEHLREWAPFDSDRNLGTVGNAKLATVGAPTPLVSETRVKRADVSKLLEFNWGTQDIRWQLEPLGRHRHSAHAVAQHWPSVHRDGRCRLAHLLRRARSASRRPTHWTHGRPRRHEVRRLAAVERRIRKAVRRDPGLRRRLADSAAPHRTPVRRAARRVVAELGRSSAGPTAIRLLGSLSRRGLLPAATAGAAVTRALSLRHDTTIEIQRTLGTGFQTRLRLDLAYSGCRELLVAPSPGAPDVGTAALLLGLARDADLVVDVGANVGLYTYLVAAAVPTAHIISFEPTPALAAIIVDNVARNGWDQRVSVRAEAVGATPASATFYILRQGDTENTLDADRLAGRDYDTISVPVVTIDDVLAADGTPPARTVLKIDVEGHERAALDGMDRTLARTRTAPRHHHGIPGPRHQPRAPLGASARLRDGSVLSRPIRTDTVGQHGRARAGTHAGLLELPPDIAAARGRIGLGRPCRPPADDLRTFEATPSAVLRPAVMASRKRVPRRS